MPCGCSKNKSAGGSTGRAGVRSDTRVQYEVFGGSMDEPQVLSTLSEARSLASANGARVRSTVVRVPAAVASP